MNLGSLRASMAQLKTLVVQGRLSVEQLLVGGNDNNQTGYVLVNAGNGTATWAPGTIACCETLSTEINRVTLDLDSAISSLERLQAELDALTVAVDACCGITPPPVGRTVTIRNQTAATPLVAYVTVGRATTALGTLNPAESLMWPISTTFYDQAVFTAWPVGVPSMLGATAWDLLANQLGTGATQDTYGISTVPPGIGTRFPNGPRAAAVQASRDAGFSDQQSFGYNFGITVTPPAPGVIVTCNVTDGNSPEAITYLLDTGAPKQQTHDSTGSYILDFIDPVVVDTDVVEAALKGINIDDTTAALVPSITGGTPTMPASWLGTTSAIQTWRTFHYADQTPAAAWVAFAVQNGIKVLVGLTLHSSDSAAAEIAAFSADYVAASPTLKAFYNANVVGIAVGNEQTNVTAMLEGIASVRAKIAAGQLPPVPVTTVLNLNPVTNPAFWIPSAYPPESARFSAAALALLPSCDLVCFNCYPYWALGTVGPLPPAEALEVSLSWTSNVTTFSVLLNQWGAVRAAMGAAGLAATPFWCTETGWSSQPIQSETPGWSTLANEQVYYGRALLFDLLKAYLPQEATEPVFPPARIFWYATRDIPSRPEWFGLYTDATALTPKF